MAGGSRWRRRRDGHAGAIALKGTRMYLAVVARGSVLAAPVALRLQPPVLASARPPRRPRPPRARRRHQTSLPPRRRRHSIPTDVTRHPQAAKRDDPVSRVAHARIQDARPTGRQPPGTTTRASVIDRRLLVRIVGFERDRAGGWTHRVAQRQLGRRGARDSGCRHRRRRWRGDGLRGRFVDCTSARAGGRRVRARRRCRVPGHVGHGRQRARSVGAVPAVGRRRVP